MYKARLIGVILLAIYLIIGGLLIVTGIQVPAIVTVVLGLISIAAGVLFLVGIRSFTHNDHHHH